MNQGNINVMFVDLLYQTNLSNFTNLKSYFCKKVVDVENSVLGNRAVKWHCDTFSTLANKDYNLLHDVNFKDLKEAILQHTIEFAKEYGVTDLNGEFLDAWINISKPGNYQEYHIHPTSHFSVIYYVDVPKNSGNTIFKGNEESNMYPIPCKEATQAGSNHWVYEPKNNDLIIFRSNMYHMVDINRSNENRVTIAANITFPY